MLGWSRFAAASASDMEASDVRLGGELAGQDHFQRHEAIETDLPGLVDDAHAAASDLFEKLIVPEIADLGPRWRAVGGAGLGWESHVFAGKGSFRRCGGAAARPGLARRSWLAKNSVSSAATSG